MAKQLHFPEFEKLKTKDFGGTLFSGNAREQRPISIKRPMHLVMRSSLAKGDRTFLKAKRSQKIRELVERAAKAQGVKIYRFANSGNHLHMIVLPTSRGAFKRFVRAISGLIARMVLGVERGRGLGLKFWDARPFTRILEWGRDFMIACDYVLQNTLEALGFMPRVARSTRQRRGRKRKKPPG